MHIAVSLVGKASRSLYTSNTMKLRAYHSHGFCCLKILLV